MFIKICGITNEDDARAAVDLGASAVGFNFYPSSPRYIMPEAAAAISQAANGVLKVGVFVNESPAEVARIMRLAGLDIAQLHGKETPDQVPPGIRIWKAFQVTRDWSAATCNAFPAEAYVLDAPSQGQFGGTGKTFDWTAAQGLTKPVILAGGLDAANVAEAIRQARPWGVDACSRLESSPGCKDHNKVRRFIEAARAGNL